MGPSCGQRQTMPCSESVNSRSLDLQLVLNTNSESLHSIQLASLSHHQPPMLLLLVIQLIHQNVLPSLMSHVHLLLLHGNHQDTMVVLVSSVTPLKKLKSLTTLKADGQRVATL